MINALFCWLLSYSPRLTLATLSPAITAPLAKPETLDP